MPVMTRTFRDVAIPVVSAAHLAGLTPPALAADAAPVVPVRFDDSQFVEDTGAAEHLLHAAHLRMLSERIPALACLRTLDASLSGDLNAARRSFDKTLDGLEHGNWTMGLLTAETDRDVLTILHRLREVWMAMQPSLDTIAQGDGSGHDLARIVGLGDDLEPIASTLSVTMMAVYSNPVLLLKRDAIALDLAGRLPMQAQRMAQSMCLAQSGLSTPDLRAELDKTVFHFSQIIEALRFGRFDIGLRPTTNQPILDALDRARADWATLHPMVSPHTENEALSPEALLALMQGLTDLTSQLDEIALLYAKASKQTL